MTQPDTTLTAPSPLAGKPHWLRVAPPTAAGVFRLRATLRAAHLNTVCEAAACPNLGDCWRDGHAAFMILGEVCTRNCSFCAVTPGRPAPPDPAEPARLAATVAQLGLQHVVITSVSRDDLPDGGAGQFAACVTALRQLPAPPRVEVLTPDFRSRQEALTRVLAARPAIFNHNLETVPRLYPQVRPAADYHHSLELLARATREAEGVITKSGLMVGLGEHREELVEVLRDLRRAGVGFVTIGQYLRPSLNHYPVARYWTPEEFARLREVALELGFTRVVCHPLARSSFHARESFEHQPP